MSDFDFEYARVIGEKLRAARQQRRISLRALAQKANISASMLSQIETGKAYPSVRSIYNIAAALDLPVDYFFPERNGVLSTQLAEAFDAPDALTASDMREVSMQQAIDMTVAGLIPPVMEVLHASARPRIVLKGGVIWSRLTAAAETGLEFLEITYACGATSGANMSRHEGREFGLILEGELLVQLGFEEVTLHQGDSIVFDSTTPHRLSNKSDQPMHALWVIWNRG